MTEKKTETKAKDTKAKAPNPVFYGKDKDGHQFLAAPGSAAAKAAKKRATAKK